MNRSNRLEGFQDSRRIRATNKVSNVWIMFLVQLTIWWLVQLRGFVLDICSNVRLIFERTVTNYTTDAKLYSDSYTHLTPRVYHRHGSGAEESLWYVFVRSLARRRQPLRGGATISYFTLNERAWHARPFRQRRAQWNGPDFGGSFEANFNWKTTTVTTTMTTSVPMNWWGGVDGSGSTAWGRACKRGVGFGNTFPKHFFLIKYFLY